MTYHIVTLAMLRKKGACPDQVALFKKLFGVSVRVTRARCLHHATDFNWSWAAGYLLPDDQQNAYYEASHAAFEAYREAVAVAFEAYDKAVAVAWKARNKADKAVAWKARAVAWKARNKADEAVAVAWKARNKAVTVAWNKLNEARAVAFYDEFTSLEEGS